MLAHRVIKMRIRRLFVYISFDCYHVTCCSLWELFKIDNGWGYIPVVNPSNKISTCTTWRHTLVLPLLTCSRSQKLAKKNIKSKSTCSLIYSRITGTYGTVLQTDNYNTNGNRRTNSIYYSISIETSVFYNNFSSD